KVGAAPETFEMVINELLWRSLPDKEGTCRARRLLAGLRVFEPVQMLDEAFHILERRNLRRILHHLRLSDLGRLRGGLLRLRQRVTSEPNVVLGHTICEHQLVLSSQVSR